MHGLRAGEGFQFGEDVPSLGGAGPLEYLVCLPQQVLGLRRVADGDGAAAQAGQRSGLITDAAGQAG
jgi:hypothetical protein